MRQVIPLFRGLTSSVLSLKLAVSVVSAWAYARKIGQSEQFAEGLFAVPKVLFDLVALAVTPGGDQE